MTDFRRLGFLAGLGMVLAYAGIPIALSFISQRSESDGLWLQTLLFLSAAITSFFIAKVKHQAFPNRSHVGLLALLTLSAVLAASYFSVVLGIGPSAADWMEKALNPIALVTIGFFFYRERPTKIALLGGLISMAGYVGLLLPALWAEFSMGDIMHLAILFPLIGAFGSSMSFLTMRAITRQGPGRFAVMSLRYGGVGLIALIIALIRGGAASLTLESVLGSLFIGGVLINSVLFFALIALERLGTIWLANFFLMVPIVTTVLESALGLANYSYSPAFLAGTAIILAGAVIGEFGTSLWIRLKNGSLVRS